MEMILTKENKRTQQYKPEQPCCGFCYLIKINVASKLDAYWLKEDIMEALPDVRCEFVDDGFQYIKVTSSLPLRVSELKSVFRHYKMEYSIVDAKKTRKEENDSKEVLNSLLALI